MGAHGWLQGGAERDGGPLFVPCQLQGKVSQHRFLVKLLEIKALTISLHSMEQKSHLTQMLT